MHISALPLHTDARRPLQARSTRVLRTEVELRRARSGRAQLAARPAHSSTASVTPDTKLREIYRSCCCSSGFLRNLNQRIVSVYSSELRRLWGFYAPACGSNGDDSDRITQHHLCATVRRKSSVLFKCAVVHVGFEWRCALVSQLITAMLQRRARLSLSEAAREDFSPTRSE